jgi:Flp pilus assembly protein TadG
MRRRFDERGQMLVMIALLLPALLLMAGLLIDTGRMWVGERQGQTAADAAALAAIKAKQDGDDTTAAANAMAAKNGFPAGSVSCAGQSAPGVVVNSPPAGGWTPPANLDQNANHYVEVIVTRRVDTVILNLVGTDCGLVSSRAVARYVTETTGLPGTPYPAVLAAACKADAIHNSANGFTIVGDWVSNGGINDSASAGNLTVTGTVKYKKFGTCGGVFSAPTKNYTPVDVSDQPDATFPVSYVLDTTNRRICNALVATAVPSTGSLNRCPAPAPLIGELLDPMSADCTYWWASNAKLGDNGPWWEGGSKTSRHLLDGVYCSGGDINLSQGETVGNVTFVGTGKITISAGGVEFTPFWNKLLILSTEGTINWSGSNGYWGGILYAPKDNVQMSGGGGRTYNAAMWGATVQISGSNWTLDSTGMGNSLGTLVETFKAGTLVE